MAKTLQEILSPSLLVATIRKFQSRFSGQFVSFGLSLKEFKQPSYDWLKEGSELNEVQPDLIIEVKQ